MVSASTALAY